MTDGPFTEAKEVLGGYWMIEVKSREEAIDWAKTLPGFRERDNRDPPGAGNGRFLRGSSRGGGRTHRNAG